MDRGARARGRARGPPASHPPAPPLPPPPQTVQNEDYFCHAHNADGLVGIAFADADYPARAAFGVVAAALDAFKAAAGSSWIDAVADSDAGNAACEAAVARFQDPAAADRLTAVQRDLDETRVVLHKTIESVLARGEKLDALVCGRVGVDKRGGGAAAAGRPPTRASHPPFQVDKSADLSLASQMFYRQARKTNSCCKMM